MASHAFNDLGSKSRSDLYLRKDTSNLTERITAQSKFKITQLRIERLIKCIISHSKRYSCLTYNNKNSQITWPCSKSVDHPHSHPTPTRHSSLLKAFKSAKLTHSFQTMHVEVIFEKLHKRCNTEEKIRMSVVWAISMTLSKTAVSPVLWYWIYCSLALNHRYVFLFPYSLIKSYGTINIELFKDVLLINFIYLVNAFESMA